MLLIPAVDIRGGKCVRLSQGRADAQKVYDEDPVEAALRWQSQGAKRLHLVDLDGAFEGQLKNANVLGRIRQAVGVPLELGGGLRSPDGVQEAFDLGMDWVILGTAAFTDKEFLKKMLGQYKDKVLVGIDAKDGWVQARGWTQSLNVRAVSAAQELSELGASGLVCTDIQTDGMLTGPNLVFLREILGAVRVPVIASGGVGSLEDLRNLARLPLAGVIVGKALYEERFNVAEALEVIQACLPNA